jgi:hypothetical protein
MTQDQLATFHSRPINYHIADQVGSGILIVGDGKVSITASNPDDGIVGVEPIQLTEVQLKAIADDDGVLTLKA